LSLWDADCEEENGLHMYLPHTAPVSGIATAPFSVEKVLSCSYDGFIRCMDIEKEVFDMLYTNDGNIMLSAICCAPHGYQSVYFAEAFGEMKMLDLRVGGVSNSYDLHEKRIQTIDFHPQNPHLVSTSSTDCTASIWDVRNMGKRQTKSIATVRHNRAVLSAYFSPSGNYLATTSYDHNVGLSNGLDSWNTTLIYHYNPPRRWISPFRAIWGWDDRYLFIGNMEKALDAICTSTKITTTLRNPLMTAIPTRLATHPFSCGTLAGATAGGRVYVWRKH
jgi:WD40 repeat protein